MSLVPIPEETELARLLHATFRRWAGNLHLGDHLPETWNAIAEQASLNRWACYHCGETFTTWGSAEDHFGKTPAAKPGCLIKIALGDERGLLMELRKAEALADEFRDRAVRAEAECESLAGQLASWERTSGCRTAHDLWCHLDSTVGKLLAASERLDAVLAEGAS